MPTDDDANKRSFAAAIRNAMARSDASLDQQFAAIRELVDTFSEDHRKNLREWVGEMACRSRPTFPVVIKPVLRIHLPGDDSPVIEVSLHMLKDALDAWERDEDFQPSTWNDARG